MTEIEKMFKNAGIKPLCQIPDKFCGVQDIYEDFTAEKQLELIKWIAKYKEECKVIYEKEYKWCTQTDWQGSFSFDNFPASLANLINLLWQSLTDQEKEEIRNILNE